MSRKRRRRRGGGNIKNHPVYNPFPQSGLVKQYEPFIKKCVGKFLKQYPRLDRQDVMFRAVELAHAAERTFKPELGFSFATHVGYRLRELHRLHEQQAAAEGVKIYRTEEDLAHEKAEEDGEPTAPVSFAGGGNGVRLIFDLQWWEALLSDIVHYVAAGPVFRAQRWISAAGLAPIKGKKDGTSSRKDTPIVPRENHTRVVEGELPTTKLRHRLKLGTQLRQTDNAPAVHERISRDLPEVVKQQPPTQMLIGWIRAVVDHLIRVQREADDEAQKRLRGDHSPTFLEAVRNAIDVKFYKGRRPPRFLSKFMPMARFDDAYSHQDGSDGASDWKRTLHDTIAAGREGMTVEQEMQEALEKAAAIRPKLTNKSDIAMLDSLVARLRGDAKGGLTAIAEEIGITKGAASKVAQRLKKRLAGQK
jgi:hypothetical protein